MIHYNKLMISVYPSKKIILQLFTQKREVKFLRFFRPRRPFCTHNIHTDIPIDGGDAETHALICQAWKTKRIQSAGRRLSGFLWKSTGPWCARARLCVCMNDWQLSPNTHSQTPKVLFIYFHFVRTITAISIISFSSESPLPSLPSIPPVMRIHINPRITRVRVPTKCVCSRPSTDYIPAALVDRRMYTIGAYII